MRGTYSIRYPGWRLWSISELALLIKDCLWAPPSLGCKSTQTHTTQAAWQTNVQIMCNSCFTRSCAVDSKCDLSSDAQQQAATRLIGWQQVTHEDTNEALAVISTTLWRCRRCWEPHHPNHPSIFLRRAPYSITHWYRWITPHTDRYLYKHLLSLSLNSHSSHLKLHIYKEQICERAGWHLHRGSI